MRAAASLLLLPLLASARPLRKTRAASSGDLTVLQFANVLEQLESQFYAQGLQKFTSQDFSSAGFSSPEIATQSIQGIQSDEVSHTKTRTSIAALGGTPISGCNFDFSSVLTDVATMVATARLVENVGVGAYLGAAHLISDPRLLEAAASILTIEARHQTLLNIFSGGAAVPGPFDIPMQPSEVLAIAGGFISGCDLGIPSNPPLKITNTGTVAAGTLLTFSADTIGSDTSCLSCQMIVGGAVNSISLPLDKCVVPATVKGPVMIMITNSTQPLAAANPIDRSTAQLVAGPAMAFIDPTPDAISTLVRTVSGSSGNSTSSEDISPGEASSVASAAGASATGSSSSNSSSSDSSSAPGTPNLSTSPGGDGTIVLGWTNLPGDNNSS